MIALNRIRDKGAIPAKYRGELKQNAELALLKSCRKSLDGTGQKIAFNQAYWKAAKDQLLIESNFKCAYCEANTKVVAHGDVEHYRPKSIYWWLAYTYDNYLYVCQICNQIYKSDNFPGIGTKWKGPRVLATSTDAELEALLDEISPDPLVIDTGYTLDKYLKTHKNEKASLVNPYLANPEKYFAYEADDVTREVTVKPSKPMYKRYFEASRDYYGINRVELKTVRYQVYKAFKALKAALRVMPDGLEKDEVADQVAFMMADEYLFAGMNRYFNTRL